MAQKLANIAQKMAKCSDQRVAKKSPGKPALGKNIADSSDKEIKRSIAEQMSQRGRRR